MKFIYTWYSKIVCTDWLKLQCTHKQFFISVEVGFSKLLVNNSLHTCQNYLNNLLTVVNHLIFLRILLQYDDLISCNASSKTFVMWTKFTGSVWSTVVSLNPDSSVWSLNNTVGVVCLLNDLLAS